MIKQQIRYLKWGTAHTNCKNYSTTKFYLQRERIGPYFSSNLTNSEQKKHLIQKRYYHLRKKSSIKGKESQASAGRYKLVKYLNMTKQTIKILKVNFILHCRYYWLYFTANNSWFLIFSWKKWKKSAQTKLHVLNQQIEIWHLFSSF